MCFSDLIQELHRQGVNLTDQQVRWALRTGAVSRPPQDGGCRFVFGPEHVEQLRKLAAIRKPIAHKAA